MAKRVPCSIVSGRVLNDLASRVDGVVPHLIGNHGLESPLTTPAMLSRAEHICEGWMQQLGTDLGQPLKIAGVEVEYKRYTLTFHYRGAQEPDRVQKELVLLLNRLTPAPRLIFGKASVNILPPGTEGKGPAVLALMRHLQQSGLFFIGDDDTDENVFELSEGLVMGVRVGRHSKSRARYYVKEQGEIEDVIRVLAHSTNRAPEFLNSYDRDTKNRKKAVHEP